MSQPEDSRSGPPVSLPRGDLTDGARVDSQNHSSAGETSSEGLGQTPQRQLRPESSLDVEESVPKAFPERIGAYRILNRLGRGTFGNVYLGEDAAGKLAAIKVAAASKVRAAIWYGDERGSLRNEAQAVRDLDHPGIVKLLAFDLPENRPADWYLAYAYIPGGTLQERLKSGPLEISTAVDMAIALAEALQYAHSRNRIHRDIKPANILLDEHGVPFLSDFGLAVTDREMLRMNSGREGTPLYFAPEQIEGEPHLVNYRADLYALGAVLYAMLSGQPPFADYIDREQLFRLIADTAPKGLRNFNPHIPKELDRICQLALRKRQEDRYQDALSFADDLKEIRQQLNGLSPVALQATPAILARDLSSSELGRSLGGATLSQSVAAAGQSSAELSLSTTGLLSASASRLPAASSSGVDALTMGIEPKGLRSFDREDADYFLNMLPGPRDKLGIPLSVAHWVQAITRPERDHAFRVGLIYGPSGCGKSSLVKAGLLPRLGDSVLSIYVEATADDTEAQLRQLVRRVCPGAWEPMLATLGESVGADVVASEEAPPLNEFLKTVRRDATLRGGRKLLIVIDQFEQWLHAHRSEMRTTELVRALRQADGEHLQIILMVRDDFWLPTSRLFRDLEVKLVEGQSQRLVDLFDLEHARNVLLAFGVAYRRLPNPVDQPLSPDQERFLEEAIRGLAQDRRVICVRLSLFAEMLRDREWSTATLRDVGGIEGVAVVFLEETFGSQARHPELRHFGQAVRALLSELLPGIGTDIKGSRRTREQLASAANMTDEPERFARLLEILDRELRIITPVAEQEAYELAHDYIVPSLREWLTKKQRETRSGRAELLLAERAAQWAIKPENRFLPSFSEWLTLLWHTNKSRWTESQRALMSRAARVVPRELALLVGIVVVLACSTYLALHSREERKRLEEQEATALRALETATGNGIYASLDQLMPVRHQVIPKLRTMVANPLLNESLRAKAGMALIKLGDRDSATRQAALRALIEFVPEALAADSKSIVLSLREFVSGASTPKDEVLTKVVTEIIAQAKRHPYDAAEVSTKSVTAKSRLALLAVYLGDSTLAQEMLANGIDPTERTRFLLTAKIWIPDGNLDTASRLLNSTKDESTRAGLIAMLGQWEVAALNDVPRLAPHLGNLWANATDGVTRSASEWTLRQWKQPLPTVSRPATTTSVAATKSRWLVNSVGMSLLELPAGQYRFSMPASDGPTLRPISPKVRFEARLAAVKTKPSSQGRMVEFAPQYERGRALFHLGRNDDALQQFDRILTDFPTATVAYLYRAMTHARLQNRESAQRDMYAYLDRELDDDSNKLYLQVVVASLLGDGQAERDALEAFLASHSTDPEWLYNSACTYGILAGFAAPTNSALSYRARALSLLQEAVKYGYHNLHHVAEDPDLECLHALPEFARLIESVPGADLARTIYLGDREVTVGQFRQFIDDPNTPNSDKPRDKSGHDRQVSRTDDCPMQRVSWNDAVLFCNWLSRREGLTPCYEKRETSMVPESKEAPTSTLEWICHFDANGYRLPTEGEWEAACRAGAATTWSSGKNSFDLEHFAVMRSPTRPHALPGGSRMPNAWGWFDMQGNVAEWCQVAAASTGERSVVSVVPPPGSQIVRGGSWRDAATEAWPSRFSFRPAEHRDNSIGFRVARAAK